MKNTNNAPKPASTISRAFAMVLLALGAAMLLSGCGSYEMQGRVVQGDLSYVQVVDADDPRLSGGTGLTGVSIRLMMDPMRAGRKVLGETVSGASGEFSIPVDKVGAGYLEYDVGLGARRRGFETAESFFRLPPGKKRILVMLSPGTSTEGMFNDEHDLMKEYERFRH